MKVKEFEKISGKKLRFMDRIFFKIAQKKLRKTITPGGLINKKTERVKMAAFLLGLGSILFFGLGFFVPGLFLGAVITGILAIVTGSIELRSDPSNPYARAGKLIGWIIIGLTALVTILAVLITLAFIDTLFWG